jgi:Tol biopolymer transport system component
LEERKHLFLGVFFSELKYIFWKGEEMKTALGLICILFILSFTCITLAWTTPQPLTNVNTYWDESQGSLSADKKTIYFARADYMDTWQVWSATRISLDQQFGTPTLLANVNQPRTYTCYPSISYDGQTLYYTSGNGIAMSTKTVGGSWTTPQAVPGLNSMGKVEAARFSADELSVVFHSQTNSMGLWDLYTASRSDKNSPFSNIRNITELNSISPDTGPSLSADGLTIYFASTSSGQWQCYTAMRTTRDSAFGAPQLMTDFAAGFNNPLISYDGKTMLLKSEYDWNLYISEIPEPATMFLLALGGLALRARK